jgi:hypothetical protein
LDAGSVKIPANQTKRVPGWENPRSANDLAVWKVLTEAIRQESPSELSRAKWLETLNEKLFGVGSGTRTFKASQESVTYRKYKFTIRTILTLKLVFGTYPAREKQGPFLVAPQMARKVPTEALPERNIGGRRHD